MFKRKRALGLLVSVSAISLMLTACSGAQDSVAGRGSATPSFKTVQSGVLTVAPYDQSPPVVTFQNGQLGALTGDFLNGFAKKYGLKIQVQNADFAGSLAATQQGRADITPYIYYTPERSKTVYYSAPLFVLAAGVFANKSLPYHGPNSLKGKKVGGIVGQVWEPYLRSAFGGDAVLFQNATDAETALVNGQVDAYVNTNFEMLVAPFRDHAEIVFHPLSNGDLGMQPAVISTYSYNVVSCGNSALAKAMDSYLHELNTSGQWAKIYDANRFPENSRLSTAAQLSPPHQGCGK